MMNVKRFFASMPFIRLFYNGKDTQSHAMNKTDPVYPQSSPCSIAMVKTKVLSGYYINDKEVELVVEYTYYANGNVLVKHMIDNRLRMVSMTKNIYRRYSSPVSEYRSLSLMSLPNLRSVPS
jgi:hypothetical protein